MGGVNRLFEEDQSKEQIAAYIAVWAKVMRQCPHETFIYDGADPTPAFKLANALITSKDPSVAVFGSDRLELTDYIKAAIEEHGPTCYACDKTMDD